MTAPVHVLFLDAQAGVGADIAVHISLARTLDRLYTRVTAATSIGDAADSSARQGFGAIPNMTLLRLHLGRQLGHKRGWGRAVAILDNARAGASLVSLARWCRLNRVDVIHVTERPRQALFGLLLARMAGCAYLIQAHISYYPDDATRFSNWRLRHADAVVGVSRFTAETYQRLAQLPPDRVFAIHNAVDSAVFRPENDRPTRLATRKRLGVPHDVPLIGCVARLMRWKGQEVLLEAFGRVRESIPDARLVLAGLSADAAPDGLGDYRDYLIRRAEALGLADAVVLPGYVSQAEMPAFYGALDVLAHPSFAEPFGLAVVEALACECAVVAIDAGGIPEIIQDGVEGLLVPSKDPSAMASGICRVLRDPALSRQLGQAGRTRVLDAFTPEIQAAAMLNVYRYIVAKRQAVPQPTRVLAGPGSTGSQPCNKRGAAG